MKKLIFTICAFAAILAVGCSKELAETSQKEYKLVVNMDKVSFGNDTRAPRTEWEDGDVVYVVFNGDVSDDEKYLVLTYNKGAWSSEWVGTTAEAVAAKDIKTFSAGYMNIAAADSTPYYWDAISALCVYSSIGEGVCVMLCDNGTYTVSGNTITMDIDMVPECAQITVRDINIYDNWTLSCDKLMSLGGFSISSLKPSTATRDYNNSLCGFANIDGVSFYGSPDVATSSLTFTLSNGEKTYTRTFIDKSLSNGDAIIMNGPFNANGTRNDVWEEVE